MKKLKTKPFLIKVRYLVCTLMVFPFVAYSFSYNGKYLETTLESYNSFGENKQDQRQVRGTVTDSDDIPIPGVNVIILGNEKVGTITDFDGNYVLDVPVNSTLVFSYMGYKTKEIPVDNQSVINIKMERDLENLDEVVVVGYGTQAKRDLTGSVSVIGGEDIASRSVTNISNALQGAAAGVSVTRSNSEPGSGNSIRIRGITTLQGDSSPLILVDDVPVKDINVVNPKDVESISVLKDAASAAIYGSRAAAGVIIITTKRAKTGVFSANYNSEYAINKPTEIRRNVGAVRYMEMFNEAIWNDNNNEQNEFSTYDPEVIANYAELHKQNPDNYPDTDWRSLILRKQSHTQRHVLTLSGGTERLKTNASFGYESQDALYKNRDWKRYTGRLNNDLKITDKFGAVLNMAFSQVDADEPVFDPTEPAITAGTIYPAVWADGRVADGKTGTNPYAKLLYGGSRENSNTIVSGKFELYVKPLEGMKISINASPNYEFRNYKRFVNSIPYWGADDKEMTQEPNYLTSHSPTNRSLDENRVIEKSLTTQAVLDYKKTFGDHSINSVFGFEEYTNKVEAIRVTGEEFISNDYPFLSQAPIDKVFDNGSGISELAYRSYFGRISYDFDKKYYLQGTVRRDASSRFGADYRWGTFPSIALGWVLSEEKFMESASFIDFLKIRASYGSLGNDRLGNYLYLSTLQFGNVLIANGEDVLSVRRAAQRYLAVSDITWETTTSFNIGVDFTTLDNRLSFKADYFDKETRDMLLGLSIPALSGFEDPTVNVGGMNTRGWELAASWSDKIGDLSYSVSANVFDAKSVVGDVAGKRLFSGNTLSEEGIEFQSWYGYQSDGIYQTQEEVDNSAVTSSVVAPGDVRYKDISGPDGVPDGEINELDQTVLDGSLPRYQYGGNISLGYKGFDFGLVFQGVAKHSFYLNPSTYATAFQGNWKSPPELIDGNYWSFYNTPEENLSARYPRIGNNNRDNNNAFSDFWLRDGSYLRIKNLTLGYTIPENVTSKINIRKLRIYLSGNDLFTFDSLPDGIDPEQGGGNSYLITKSFLIGLQLSI
ncbi:SusC/RagA family TonB-linked outer membrane protein [Sinomicrobium soli]|uniref:SusC/RagA family TonB-linked outer membrane protein n=1 Tax=Sinomicrobium sp. N-1-3-6 TaxID=2219864 RepID=UPI000DCF0414|nr:TonB-dependent receptor [Sinomicrobium sp. N-1-3-6]RAV30089.1 SusC/RagA family TonB-linked outer membrane protein [Sinomicrobium sp. N-1-3-6]